MFKHQGTQCLNSIFYLAFITSVAIELAYTAPHVDSPVVSMLEYNAGETAVLNCDSNDDKHIFRFWQFTGNDLIIGPGNDFDKDKYKYDILTGKLYIKNVSPKETGLYKCYSRGVYNKDFYIKNVELVVEKDWKVVNEDNTDLNLLRALMGTTVLLIFLGAGYVILRVSRRRIPHMYLDTKGLKKDLLLATESSDEEDSAEEVFTSPRPSTSKASNEYQNVVLDKANTSLNGLKESSGRKNTDIETDFQAVFAAIAPQK
ncbi:uncharacterized protein LOC123305499 [Chrysoperla carnea]|uniref:uncharacterized protein LOC123305499 n=1 Tax=Chrysoperla carnea TaxID=189513 RepID=UPI001D072E57|nr:uncharacterized protein LOC123305499 [Chrysoperla carnea]